MSRKHRAAKSTGTAKGAAAPPSRKLVVALLLGFTFAVFANTLANQFAYDDTTQILQNELIRDVSNLPTAFTKEVWFWRAAQDQDPNKTDEPSTPYYRPMFIVYLIFGWHLFGATPFGWHLANVLMHLVAVYFAFRILEHVSGDLRVAAVGTLLFAVHPLRVESVAWISGVTDLFLAVFLFPAFYYYMRYRQSGQPKPLVVSLGLFLIAAFSKEPAVALPIFIAAYEVLIIHQERPLRRRLRSAVYHAALFLVVPFVYFGLRYKALGFILSDPDYQQHGFMQVVLTIPIAVWKYMGLLVWPAKLSIFHGTPMVNSPLEWRFYVPFLALLGLGAGLWQLRHSMTARFAMLWFAIHLLPVLNLSAFDPDFLVQERYVYVPSLGFSLLVAMGLLRIPVDRLVGVTSRRAAQAGLAAVIVLLLAGKSVAQNFVWYDDEKLWTTSAQVAADQPMAYYVLGRHYIKTRQPLKLIEAYEKYLEVRHDNLNVISNLAAGRLLAFEQDGDRTHVDRAVELCEEGLNRNQNRPDLWDTLAYAHMLPTHHQNADRARAFMLRALKLQPENPIFHLRLASLYASMGQHEQAFPYLDNARRLTLEQNQQPPPELFKLFSYAYASRGQYQEAVDSLNAYLQMSPYARDAAKERERLEDLRTLAQAARNLPSGATP